MSQWYPALVHTTTLRTLAAARGLNQSDLARMAGVSRQAASSWFRGGRVEVDVKGRVLMALSAGLGVSPSSLCQPLPVLDADRQRWQTEFLWDGLYPTVEAFAAGLARGQDRALARLVDRVGLFEAATVAGDCVWARFSSYGRLLHPARKEGLGRLWTLRHSRASS